MSFKSRDPKYGGIPTPAITSIPTATQKTDYKPVARTLLIKDTDYKKLFLELWTALQGIRDCLDTWDEDGEWAGQNPNKAYPGSKSEGLGRRFQLFNVKHRINWEDIHNLNEAIKRVEKVTPDHNNTIDNRKK